MWGETKRKEIHITSTGLSILTNAKKEGMRIPDPTNDLSWEDVSEDSHFLKELESFVLENPTERSAELNAFLHVVKGKPKEKVSVFLVGTKTYTNEVVRRVLTSVLNHLGYKVIKEKEYSGYFFEKERFDREIARKDFEIEVAQLVDDLVFYALRKKEEGYQVYFNATGGLKAHVVAMAVAGYLTASPVYYKHERFDDVIFMPPLFYLPKGKEIEILLSISKDGKIPEGIPDEQIERLHTYGLIDFDSQNQVRITQRGKVIVEFFRSREG